MRKGKDPKPDPYQYLLLIDPDPGGPITCGSGSAVPDPDPQHCFYRYFNFAPVWLRDLGEMDKSVSDYTERRGGCWGGGGVFALSSKVA
jgi:hypothetical protein